MWTRNWFRKRLNRVDSKGINPYTWLVDVLQRISQHPASQAIELTPRVWKEKFADKILKSDLDRVGQ